MPSAHPALGKGGFATVDAATRGCRSRPDTAAAGVATLASGDIVAITGGPVQADGYSWYQVSGPLQTWAPTEPVRSGKWVAGRDGSVAYLVGRTPPNTTIVDAGLAGLSFGAGGPASLGSSPAALAARAFSPNGDGSEDGLAIRWTNGVALDGLTLRVLRADGSIVGTRAVPDVAPGAQVELGRDGWRASPGRRAVRAAADRHGRVADVHGAIRQAADRQPGCTLRGHDRYRRPRLTGASAAGRLVSPTRDGRHDSIAVRASSAGATRWRLTAALLSGVTLGAPIRTLGGSGGVARTSWNGRTDAGTPAGDGRYRLTIAVLDGAGNFAARSWDVVVDGSAPVAIGRSSPPSFSPDGDGVADSTVIDWTMSEPAATTVRIYRGAKLVRTFSPVGSKAAGAIRWNGRSGAGVVVGDGTYQVRITGQDAAGNRRTSSVAVRLDRTAGRLRWAPASFYPQDLDALARIAQASFKLSRAATTTLQVVDGAGQPVRTAWTGRRQRAGVIRWTWDGRDGAGRMVAPGTYGLVLTATGAYGTTSLRQPIVVDAFAVSLSAMRLKPGKRLVVSFSSVEGLSSRPVVSLDQTGRPPVTRFATLVGPGRYTASFTVAAGGNGPAIIRISGRDSAGGRNATSRTITVQ